MAKEAAQLIAMRFVELFCPGALWPVHTPITTAVLIEAQEGASFPMPIDRYTDCNGLYELVTGMKGVPQDKTQRLYILSIREDRVSGRIRRFIKIPTESMCVDPLTKHMVSPNLMTLLTTGFWILENTTKQYVKFRVAPRRHDFRDHDLVALEE